MCSLCAADPIQSGQSSYVLISIIIYILYISIIQYEILFNLILTSHCIFMQYMQIFIYCATLVFFYRERCVFQIQPLIFVTAIVRFYLLFGFWCLTILQSPTQKGISDPLERREGKELGDRVGTASTALVQRQDFCV